MALYHVSITGRDRRHLTALGAKFRVVVVGYRETKQGIVVDAYLPEEKIGWVERKGYAVKRHEKIDPLARQRQAEERAAVGARMKSGRYGDVIWAGGYLTADEVEKAVALGEKNHRGYLERIPLPNLTWEKRRCHAVRIGARRGERRPAVCFIGGIHGREWGSPDILVYFAMRLLRAYRTGKSVRLGSKSFSAAEIRSIVDKMDVVLFPQVNPDGRRFSMEHHPMWRKNRRPAPRGRGHRSIGVDLNRNFPFLWRFERYFAPGTVASSRNPGDYETYVGTREASEPETRNVMWLLDRFPNIRYLIDLHSYGETILHSWGSDDNQSHDPRMNFRNRRYDGKRGLIHDDVYREHIARADQRKAVRMGECIAAAIERVRGRRYRVQQSVGLYPTAASTDDYAYSRHLVDPKKGKIIAFTMEWGRSRAVTPFHPPYDEMRKVMREVTAGLLECCLRARQMKP
ncbi:MAG TPA: M14 family metallopeptidase [Steroidobacteraceae bacterium]|nr:M14 family metallopeptidase [Steroidobacteraceae bacterium]